MTVASLCRQHGMRDETFYKWRSKYCGMDVSEARRLRGLEEENQRPSGSWPSRPWTPSAQGNPKQKRGKPVERRLIVRYAIDVHGFQSDGPVS